jgi:hypothetical protein
VTAGSVISLEKKMQATVIAAGVTSLSCRRDAGPKASFHFKAHLVVETMAIPISRLALPCCLVQKRSGEVAKSAMRVVIGVAVSIVRLTACLVFTKNASAPLDPPLVMVALVVRAAAVVVVVVAANFVHAANPPGPSRCSCQTEMIGARSAGLKL